MNSAPSEDKSFQFLRKFCLLDWLEVAGSGIYGTSELAGIAERLLCLGALLRAGDQSPVAVGQEGIFPIQMSLRYIQMSP